MKTWKSIALIVLLFAMSCKNSMVAPLAEINQLEFEGVIMPVHIYGDTESKTAVIVIHGGPGESAILQREAIGLQRLEEQVRIAYYDQRGSGISEGNVDEATLTLEQMSADLNAVVQLVKAGGSTSIFLLSLDWGAAIAVHYLASDNRDADVKGLIAASPGFNAPLSMSTSRSELIELATQLLMDGSEANDEPAQNLLDFYDANPVINRFNFEEHYQVLENLGGVVINQDYEVSGAEPPAYIESVLENNRRYLLEHYEYRNTHFLESLDVEDLLTELEVPVKLIWGVWDRVIPISLAERYQSMLSGASSEELISVFTESAHRPYLEEGDRFFATVATWVTFYE